MRMVRIGGGGLAGSAAALAALDAGAKVRFWDPARLPRHKVCGEFLTPEAAGVLRELGVWDQFVAARPAVIRKIRLAFENRVREEALPEPGYGISRYQLDALLRGAAIHRGAQWECRRAPEDVEIVAYGRQHSLPGHDRLFGFKTHFRGPVNDAVELYFFEDFYVGVSPIENGLTNVCGLGPESALRKIGFDYQELISRSPILRERLAGSQPAMDWRTTGPLRYSTRLDSPPSDVLLAGDALQFIDPFTGSGMAAALWTGALAGRWAAELRPTSEFYAATKRGIYRQFEWAGRLRTGLGVGWLRTMAPYVPASWLFRVTRPRLTSLSGSSLAVPR